MVFARLTFRSVNVRPVIVPLRRPVVSKVGLFDQWPIILIDLVTEEGLENPYRRRRIEAEKLNLYRAP